MTPPLDEQDEEESHELEAKARSALEEDGCPPCYPKLELGVDPPQQCQTIMEYWKSFPGTDDMVLCSQLENWQRFRRSQKRPRTRGGFSELVNGIRKRRQKHGLVGDVCLQLDPRLQSQRENWVEFQDYHLRRLERREEKQDALKKELADKTANNGPSRPADDVTAVRRLLENATFEVDRQRLLLQWIEQERQSMIGSHAMPVDNTAKPRPDIKQVGRARRAKAPAVLGKARVTKPKPRSRKTRIPNGDPDVALTSSDSQAPNDQAQEPVEGSRRLSNCERGRHPNQGELRY